MPTKTVFIISFGSLSGCIPKATKAALLLSSGSAGSTVGAIATYKGMVSYMGMEDVGVCQLSGDENKSEEKLAAIRDFASKL